MFGNEVYKMYTAPSKCCKCGSKQFQVNVHTKSKQTPFGKFPVNTFTYICYNCGTKHIVSSMLKNLLEVFPDVISRN